MYKVRMVIASLAILAAQQVFADATTDMSSDGDAKSCLVVVKACKAAGFVRRGGTGKRFWMDCMKPVLLGQSVKGVTVDAATVKDCRTSKIAAIKQKLQELQQAQ
jgi:hypothetical protein